MKIALIIIGVLIGVPFLIYFFSRLQMEAWLSVLEKYLKQIKKENETTKS